MGLCDAKFYLVNSEADIIGSLIMVALYLFVLGFCALSTYRTVKKVNLKEEFILVPIMITLGVTLLLRVIYMLGGISPFCYEAFWYYYFGDFASLSKDICLLCLLIRVWEYLGSLESAENTYEKNKTYTYVFMITHFFIGYIFLLIEDYEAWDDVLVLYLGGVQIMLLFVFGYAFYKLFFTIRENPDTSVENEVLVMNATSILVVITLLAQIIFNLAIKDSGISQDAIDVITYVFIAIAELIPCALITFILFLQQQNLTDSVLRGSSFAKNLP